MSRQLVAIDAGDPDAVYCGLHDALTGDGPAVLPRQHGSADAATADAGLVPRNVALVVETSGSTDSAGIIAYLNTLNKYPGYFGDYTFTPTQHNGYPTDEVVMSEASTAKNGTFALAPGYS